MVMDARAPGLKGIQLFRRNTASLIQHQEIKTISIGQANKPKGMTVKSVSPISMINIFTKNN